MGSVVGDAVEHRLCIDALVVGQNAVQVDPAEELSIAGGDTGDAVVVPDIGVDFALDVLQLVELLDGSRAVVNDDVARFPERDGIAETQRAGAVAGDDGGFVVGHAPALAGVGELADGAEGEAVVDEAGVGLPGPLVEIGPPVDNALAEILRRDLVLLDRVAGRGRVGEKSAVPFKAGALVEEAVEEQETFGVALGGMRELVDDLVAVHRRFLRLGGSAAKGGEGQGDESEASGVHVPSLDGRVQIGERERVRHAAAEMHWLPGRDNAASRRGWVLLPARGGRACRCRSAGTCAGGRGCLLRCIRSRSRGAGTGGHRRSGRPCRRRSSPRDAGPFAAGGLPCRGGWIVLREGCACSWLPLRLLPGVGRRQMNREQQDKGHDRGPCRNHMRTL